MSLSVEELGTREMRLRWIVAWRITCMLAIPLFVPLLFNSWIVKTIFWLITVAVFWNLISAWGHSVIAISTVLIPLYIYFEWDNAPSWIAYLTGIIFAWQIYFINRRMAEINDLKREMNVIEDEGVFEE